MADAMIMGAVTSATREFSWPVFLTLALVFGLSVGVFFALVRRWTRSRLWIEISTWARRRGYRARLNLDAAPPPLDRVLPRAELHLTAALSNGTGGFFRLESVERTEDATPGPPARWHVLIRPIEVDWPPTALRPSGAASSFVDLYSLASFPLMGDTQRFVVFGSDSAPARNLSKSSARSLLPQDVGLMLHGRHMMLDFSNRPFDPIEFERMEALAGSVAAHLPT
jgi:hypothetical protein